ncbi:hypothetical protein FD723_24465 [Nostoc sp. C052]|uniref:hypothetical protein n=1 Tax=unclassified Nostoc TaxID=2593658 RepID=UPI0015C2E3D6|nr:hypothetical protein [Nostoc sp. C052]QLE43291.1 hypothetical protein FD723_24465 [Nostoc sp. C052]
MNMKRILSSCLLGVLLTSSVLADRASAQVEVILGNNHRHEWHEREQARLALLRREREQRERREWEHRQHEKREWRLRHEHDYR